MTRSLQVASVVVLGACLLLAVWVDVSRVRWEQHDNGYLGVVRATQLTGMSLAALHAAGIDAVAVRASVLASGGPPTPTALRDAGLRVILILDETAPVSLAAQGPFAGMWVEGSLGPDDPLLRTLLAAGTPLIQREFMPETLARAEWAAGFHRLLRADEVPARELEVLSRGALLARWERALRERGVRVAILTPIPGQGPQQALTYYQSVNETLKELGYRNGVIAAPAPDPGRAVEVVLHIGVCVLLLLTLLEVLPRFPGAGLLVFAAVAAAAAGLGGTVLAQGDAFLIAVLAPVYAVLLFFRRRHAGLGDGIALLLLFSAFAVIGGLLMAAVLAQPVFMLKVAQFRGVKAALLFPPVFGALLSAWQVGWRFLLPASRGRRAVYGAMVLVAAAAVAYLLVRSGNAQGWVTGAELRTRTLLERLFVARPRFKEFLVGHPLLLLYGAWGSLGGGLLRYRPFLLFFGLVGQVSILNSFAHAHTPLLLTLWRTGNGLLLGILIGILLYLGLRGAVGAWRRAVPWLRAHYQPPNISAGRGGRDGS
jgi:hypothetical protein